MRETTRNQTNPHEPTRTATMPNQYREEQAFKKYLDNSLNTRTKNGRGRVQCSVTRMHQVDRLKIPATGHRGESARPGHEPTEGGPVGLTELRQGCWEPSRLVAENKKGALRPLFYRQLFPKCSQNVPFAGKFQEKPRIIKHLYGGSVEIRTLIPGTLPKRQIS